MSFPGARVRRAASWLGSYGPPSEPGLLPQLRGASRALHLALFATNYELGSWGSLWGCVMRGARFEILQLFTQREALRVL